MKNGIVKSPAAAERFAARFSNFSHPAVRSVVAMINGYDEGHGPGDFAAEDIVYPASLYLEVRTWRTHGFKDENERDFALSELKARFERITKAKAETMGVGNDDEGQIYTISVE